MTKIKIFKKADHIACVECTGHAGYAENGQDDIVCASVSTLTQTAVLGLMQIAGINLDYKIDGEKGYLKFTVPDDLNKEQRHDADVILGTMYCGIKDLNEGFSKFVKVEVL